MNLQNHKTIRNLLVLVVAGVTAYFFCNLLTVLMVSRYGTYVVYVVAAVVVSLVSNRWIYGIATAVLSALIQYWLQPSAFHVDSIFAKDFVFDGTAFVICALLLYYLVRKLYQPSELTFPSPKNMRRLQEKNVVLREENEDLRARSQEVETEAQQEKVRADLLRAVSHDLRTPLTSIAGESSLLAEQGEEMSVQERQRLCQNIREEALWLNYMVENLLSVTKMSNGEIQLHKTVEIVEEILQETMTKFRRYIPQQEVEVYVPMDEILMAPMDTMLIEQVLLNLLENAVRHSRVTKPIIMSAVREGQQVVFRVRDYGRGIAEENMDRLFRGDFSKEDSTRGMGIGLSVCAAIVAAHGGEIHAENQAEGGAEFRFSLPLEEK